MAPQDYTAQSGTVTSTPGQTPKTVSVAVLGDANRESSEQFRVQLSQPVGGLMKDAVAVGTILNGD